nr:PREDICTED: mammalian ependymin-related protein 1 [Opisthocomus hoazin]
MEKSTVQGGTHGPRGLHGGASCLPQTVREAAAISFSKFLAFLEVSQAVQFREAVKLIAFVVTASPQIAHVRFFEYILLYNDAVMFQIEQVTKLCSKIALTEPWDPYDIPANSTYEDQYYIGGPGDKIMVQEWSDRKPARKLESWVGIYTVKDCYPVQETYTRNYSVTTSTRFFDLQLGIADPSVFTPPSTCQTAQLRKMKDDC